MGSAAHSRSTAVHSSTMRKSYSSSSFLKSNGDTLQPLRNATCT